ncbi:MAG: flagellar hook-length control protein FliK [Desulfovibrionales bacterium]
MQIFPTQSQTEIKDVSSFLGSVSGVQGKQEPQSFVDLFRRALTGKGETASGQKELQTPSLSNTSTEKDYPKGKSFPATAIMTLEDFSQLEKSLVAAGMDRESLAGLQKQIAAGELSFGGFIQQVQRIMVAAGQNSRPLDQMQKRDLTSLFQKIGFTPQQSEQLVQKVEKGEHQAVLAAMTRAVSQNRTEKIYPVTRRELQTFSDLLQLSPDNRQKVAALLQGTSDSREMNSGQLRAVLAALQQGLGKSLKHRDEGYETFVRQVAVVAHATGIRPQPVMHSEKGANSASGANNANGEIKHDQAMNLAGGGKSGEKADAKSAEQKTEDPGLRQQNPHSALHKGKEAGEGKDEPWSMLWDKVRSEFDSKAGHVQEVASLARSEASPAANARPVDLPKVPHRAIFDQVESGILQGLGQGRRQLTLQLNPPDLGRVQVILQVHNKEVQAVIRSGNQEVHRAIAEQVVQLRESLEQQGFKVTKLDVQTQTENQQFAGTWNGAEGHNKQWEQTMKQMRQSRWLSRGGHSGHPGDDLQEKPEPGAASDGLDIFA